MRNWEDKGRGMWQEQGSQSPILCTLWVQKTPAFLLGLDSWKEHLPVLTMKKIKKHFKPQVHVFSQTHWRAWLRDSQLTPNLRRQVAGRRDKMQTLAYLR